MTLLEAAVARPRKFGKKLARAGNHAAQQMFVQELIELEDRAHRLGLHVTGHALNHAKNAVGWEIVGDIERAGKAARDERPRR